MTKLASTGANSRSAAIAELFDALEELMIVYQALPAADRTQRWSTDAERITGEVARQLSAARTRISATFDPTARHQRPLTAPRG